MLISSYSGFENHSDLFLPMLSDRSSEPDRNDPPSKDDPVLLSSVMPTPDITNPIGDEGDLKFEPWSTQRFDFLDSNLNNPIQPINDLNNPISELNNPSTAPTTDVSDQFLPGDLLTSVDTLLNDDRAPAFSNQPSENNQSQGPQLGLFLLGDTKSGSTWTSGSNIW